MAIPVARLIRDQNIDLQCSGGAPLTRKADISKSQKKGGGPGMRKALNDISNSGKPSALQASKKHYPNNVISIEKDIGVSKTPFSIGGKSNIVKVPQKGKVGGRKALSDVTNSEKPSLQPVSRKSQDKKLSTISEEYPRIAIKEEGFLHNHQECIAQRKTGDKESFLKLVGLGDGSPFVMLPPSSILRPESPLKLLEMEEMPTSLKQEDRVVVKCERSEFPGYYCLPACASPVSPKSPYANWKEDNFPNFSLIETPKWLKR